MKIKITSGTELKAPLKLGRVLGGVRYVSRLPNTRLGGRINIRFEIENYQSLGN